MRLNFSIFLFYILLFYKIGVCLKLLFYGACKINRWWISELNIPEDYVHLTMQIKPSESVGEVVKILKGGTSRVIRKRRTKIEDY